MSAFSTFGTASSLLRAGELNLFRTEEGCQHSLTHPSEKNAVMGEQTVSRQLMGRWAAGRVCLAFRLIKDFDISQAMSSPTAD